MLQPKGVSDLISARRGGWRALPLLFLLGWTAISAGAFQDPKPRSRVLETLSTRAGVVKLVRVDDAGIGETNWYVTLRGKTVYGTKDDVFGSVGFHSIFKSGLGGEVILLQETFDTGGCSEFRLLEIRSAGRATVTTRFGNCSSDPVITQSAATVTFSFPAKGESAKREIWTYQSGVLTRQ